MTDQHSAGMDDFARQLGIDVVNYLKFDKVDDTAT